MGNELVVSGLDELDRALQLLPVKLENKILRGAVRAGAKVFLLEARKYVPVEHGDLRKSLRIKTSSRYGVVKAMMVAGNKKVYYPHMVEFGTARHLIKPATKKSLFVGGAPVSQVNHPGAKAQPFMRPAFKAGQQAALDAVANYIRNRLAKEAAKK